MSETEVLSDAIFDALMKMPPDEVKRDPRLRFINHISSKWKREKNGEVQTDLRPHIIGCDERARAFISSSFFWGAPFPIGYVYDKDVDDWVPAFRFKLLPISSVAGIVKDLHSVLAQIEQAAADDS